ncbi:MAG: 3-phosphoshikimate 1-carboxyvinyltransferase [Proteobacteria bacterium]|nr:3-phosphoshikimate 1-carboxyvinyltransferase [Pseudomonadota bacterium]
MSAPLKSSKASPLTGEIRVPGDKSISHRALMFGGLAVGETRIAGLLEGEDVLATAAALRAFGCAVAHDADGAWRVRGRGVGGLAEPSELLDLGNSGTAMRLFMGIAAAHPFTSFFTGDASLRARPMARVATPLSSMGARFVSRSNWRLPLAVIGSADLMPIEYTLPVASAQVKSAILLAGLHAPGETTVIEPQPTRDHTELMLRHFGAEVRVEDIGGARRVTVVGERELAAADIVVPGDPSSAAFALVAAAIVPGSSLICPGVGLNPLRAGLIDTLLEMGADITVANRRVAGGEPVGDLTVRHGPLTGVVVPAERAPRMIDEYPVLAVAAAHARGATVMHGLGELRVKESDRLSAIVDGMRAAGATVAVEGDRLTVEGRGAPLAGGAAIATNLDHRIAMAFLVLGAATERPMQIDDGRPIDTSFPGFAALMNAVGLRIERA